MMINRATTYGRHTSPNSYFADTRTPGDRPTVIMRMAATGPVEPPEPLRHPGDFPPESPHWHDLVEPPTGNNDRIHDELAVQHGWDWRPSDEPEPDPERPSRMLVLIFTGLALLVIVLSCWLVQRTNLLPVGVPVLGKDTGVAACEAIADGGSPTGTGNKQLTMDEYTQLRSVFADSRYDAIRTNGTKLIDLAYQIQGTGSDDLGALVFISSLGDAYAGLAGGCADAGHPIPALGLNGK